MRAKCEAGEADPGVGHSDCWPSRWQGYFQTDARRSSCLYGSNQNHFDFTTIPDFGEIMQDNLYKFFAESDNMREWDELMVELHFEKEEDMPVVTDSTFAGKSIVATGSLKYFSRNGINRYIEKLGGSAKGSVSRKRITSFTARRLAASSQRHRIWVLKPYRKPNSSQQQVLLLVMRKV